jgi:hypothetical protein
VSGSGVTGDAGLGVDPEISEETNCPRNDWRGFRRAGATVVRGHRHWPRPTARQP